MHLAGLEEGLCQDAAVKQVRSKAPGRPLAGLHQDAHHEGPLDAAVQQVSTSGSGRAFPLHTALRRIKSSASSSTLMAWRGVGGNRGGRGLINAHSRAVIKAVLSLSPRPQPDVCLHSPLPQSLVFTMYVTHIHNASQCLVNAWCA